MNSIVFRQVMGEREGQPVAIEGVHAPDQLAQGSGVWIATAGSAMFTTGTYAIAPQNAWMMIMCQQGSFHLSLNELKIKGRECCLIPRNQSDVLLRVEQEARIIWLVVDGPLADDFMVKLGGMSHRAMKQGALPSQLKLGRHIVQAAVRIGAVKEASSAQLQQLLWGLLASQSGQAVAMDAVLSHEIAKVIDAMRKNQYRDSFSLNDMAALSRMPVETFRKRFVSEVGMPPQSYQLFCKMERAKTLLKNGLTVRQAGIEVGMEDPYHFSKTFKNIVGMSPSHYSKTVMTDA